MNNSWLTPDFDGKKWKCKRCSALLATVGVVEHPFIEPSGDLNTRRVAVLELPRGFVFHKGQNLWLKPAKVLPFQRGKQEKESRIYIRDYRRRQLEHAQKIGDVATVGSATIDLQRLEETQASPSLPANETEKSEQLGADRLPARFECPNARCRARHLLPSVRGVIS
jgi:hypothetical protein